MNLAHLHRRGIGYGSPAAALQLRALADLGVRDIAINPFAYTRSLTSPDIRWGDDPTLTDDDVLAQCAQAKALGLRVLMKPHLWSSSYWTGQGNSDIVADDWGVWFERYTAYAVHYARLATAGGCESLCVGLEYTQATKRNPGAWGRVADACRQVFGGEVLYAANWYEEWEQFRDWDRFDTVGIDAYFPLLTPGGVTAEALVAAWQPHLDAIERLGKPVVFAEAGYQAVVGTHERPWASHVGPADPVVQALAYEALLRACTARPWFRGVYWWKWFTEMPGERDAFVPEQPAQDVMRAWFAQP